jgi:hypothetical protein
MVEWWAFAEPSAAARPDFSLSLSQRHQALVGTIADSEPNGTKH